MADEEKPRKRRRAPLLCHVCRVPTQMTRVDRWDAICCRVCLTWLEEVCGDPEGCPCTGRPPTAEGSDWADTWNTEYAPADWDDVLQVQTDLVAVHSGLVSVSQALEDLLECHEHEPARPAVAAALKALKEPR